MSYNSCAWDLVLNLSSCFSCFPLRTLILTTAKICNCYLSSYCMQLTPHNWVCKIPKDIFPKYLGEKIRHRRANYKALHSTLGKSNQRFIRPSPPVERWSPQSQPSLIKMSLAINEAFDVRQGLCRGWRFSCKGQLVLCISSGRHGSLLQKEPCRAGSDFSWVLGLPGVPNPPAPRRSFTNKLFVFVLIPQDLYSTSSCLLR